MAYYLEPQTGGQQIVLDKAVLLIGRGSECDVVLANSRKVSRKHCCIAQVDHKYVLRDLSSMNGVRVNGKKVQRESELQVGDEIAFADVSYVLRQTGGGEGAKPEKAAAAAAPPALPANRGRPLDISQKFPVPIADEEVEFAVEGSAEGGRSPLADLQVESSAEISAADDDSEPEPNRDEDEQRSSPA